MNIPSYEQPALYCGTYGKYNSGSIAGEWLQLNDYTDEVIFWADCKQIHRGEYDPEFMFQDMENLPRELYQECGIHPELFNWLALDDDQRQLAAILLAQGWDAANAIEAARDGDVHLYEGRLDFYAHEQIDALYEHNLPDPLIDAEAYARDDILNGEVALVKPSGVENPCNYITADYAVWLIGANR